LPDLSRVNRLGVRAAERADPPPFWAMLAFDARAARLRDAVGSGPIRLDSGSTATSVLLTCAMADVS
jgi:hypothetical protein